MKPSEKAPEIEKALDAISQNQFGRTRTGAITSDTCVACGKAATEFRDELSRKEFSISGLCQNCQDEVFKEE